MEDLRSKFSKFCAKLPLHQKNIPAFGYRDTLYKFKSVLVLGNSPSFFLDTGAFTTPVAEVVQFRTAHLTYFIQHDAFDIW